MSIGVNLRVTYHTSIGGRKYQEDCFSVAYQETEHDGSLQFAFFGIYDGHGGAEASLYAKEHLMDTIVSQKLFWSENDDDVLKAIREGYIQTHYSMWREQEKWPKTSSGLPSTAGTTASIAFIRRGKIYVGHVGDSAIVLGYQKEKEPTCEDNNKWGATLLTVDHKPETYAEKMRIMSCGGKVITKSGVPRVVWNRPRIGHKGPVRRSTPIDEIPFLAVARSLGDLWSYNSVMNEFVVSPDPDVSVIEIDPKKYRCLIFGTDGLWNVLSPKNAVEIVQAAEMDNVRITLEGGRDWKNPSKLLVDEALQRWSKSNMKADNTSVVIIMLDPPGPRKLDVLRSMRTSIQPVECEVNCTQPLEKTNVSLFDHASRELIDISQVTCQTSPHYSRENLQHPSYFDPSTPGSYQDISYTGGFDESYNTFLNINFHNEHSYTNYTTATQPYSLQHHHNRQPQQQDIEVCNIDRSDEANDHNRTDFEETYSLTNLRTKSERVHSDSMQASVSSLSSPAYIQEERTGNVIMIENFHDYSLSHMSARPSYQSYQYQHSSYQHRYDEQPTYHMERYDYYDHQEEQVGCNYNQNYSSHDLSEHSYESSANEFSYPENEAVLLDVAEPDEQVECVEIRHCDTTPVVENVAVDSETVSYVESQPQHNWLVSEPKSRNEQDEADIQINEISSSLNSSTLSSKIVPQTARQVDSTETKATSSGVVCIATKTCAVKRNVSQLEKEKVKKRKSFKSIVKIVYETRSSQKSHRKRAQQENFNGKTIRKKITKFLRKNANVRSVLGFKKSRKSDNCNLMDDSTDSVKAKSSRERTCVQKRVLRSMDQVEIRETKPLHKTCRTVDNTSSIGIRAQSATEAVRKLSKRQISLRKVTSDVKRVRR